MTVYQQMGHQSENLLREPYLWRYKGAILSPVNYTQMQIANQTSESLVEFDTVFDGQLYFPQSERGHLRKWTYYPQDVDTADMGSDRWWDSLAEGLAATCADVRPRAGCSPAIVPRGFANEYFSRLVRVASRFSAYLDGTSIRPIQTAIVGLNDLAVPGRSMEIASILSSTELEEVYLVMVGNTEPRRELRDTEELKGAMRLLDALREAGLKTIVGYCSSDVILWKAAGAFACATGKFFNLRRFTSSRFEEPSQGGGQLPYWFEESLVAFLREADVLRLSQLGKLGQSSVANPYSLRILHALGASGTPWLGDSWRQYMYAFADLESRLNDATTDPADLLADAERAWLALEDDGFLMEEARNDGSWLRPWRRALSEYSAA